MPLPNMTAALNTFSIDLKISQVKQLIVNGRPIERLVDSTIQATVQIANPDEINSDAVDFSKSYLLIHTAARIKNNDRCEYEGVNYRAISIKDYSQYGFVKCIFEEIE